MDYMFQIKETLVIKEHINGPNSTNPFLFINKKQTTDEMNNCW